jgi:serine/threonine protein kinase
MTALREGLAPGTLIDGWRVVKTLGDGGFAVVYLVEKDGQEFALKLARHGPDSQEDDQAHARARREVTILSLLDHPNIVQQHGHGKWPDPKAGHVYTVLDYVDGWTLGEWVQRKHITFHELVSVIVKIAIALAYMHSKGVLHRDLKLANVVIRKSDGEPIIIDFGCATHTQADDLTESGLHPSTERNRAPEQFTYLRAHKEEHRARYAFQVADEIFAVGAMLYDVLTDPRPTEERERPILNSNVMTPSPARKLNPRVPPALSEWVETLLSRDPKKRPVDTEALRREAAELAADTSADYMQSVHLPSEQWQPAPSDGEEPAALEPARKLPWARLRAVGARVVAPLRAPKVLAVGTMAATVALVLGLWFNVGDVPEPPRALSVPPVPASAKSGPVPPLGNASPMSTPATAPAEDTAPAATADVQKEGSTVTIQKPEDTQPAGTPRGQKPPPSAAQCKKLLMRLGLAASLAAGCTGAQLRPEPFECPSGAERAMREELGWSGRQALSLTVDDRYDEDADPWFSPGDIVSVVPKSMEDMQPKAPPGTRFYGQVYVVPGHPGGVYPGHIIVKYDRVEFEGGRKLPICFMVGEGGSLPALELKDGKGKAQNSTAGFVTLRWP